MATYNFIHMHGDIREVKRHTNGTHSHTYTNHTGQIVIDLCHNDSCGRCDVLHGNSAYYKHKASSTSYGDIKEVIHHTNGTHSHTHMNQIGQIVIDRHHDDSCGRCSVLHGNSAYYMQPIPSAPYEHELKSSTIRVPHSQRVPRQLSDVEKVKLLNKRLGLTNNFRRSLYG